MIEFVTPQVKGLISEFGLAEVCFYLLVEKL